MDLKKGSLILRRIRSEDAAALAEIQAAITKSAVNIDFAHLIEEQERDGEDLSFVAEIDGTIAGFMLTYILNGGFGLEKSAWIATMGVSPRFMGQGIGVKLAEEIFRVCIASGISRVFTSVRWDSADLLSFFKTLGFDRSNFINLCKDLDS